MIRRLLPASTPRRLALAGVATAALLGSTLAAAPALAATPAPGGQYLALGDSIAFGYVESNATTPPNYLDASSFVGYPEDIASDLNLQVANAACPGETTGSFLNTSAPSNGCENSPNPNDGGAPTGPGYRSGYLLHESYAGSQLSYAKSFLKTHPNTQLITLQLGANDGLLCQETTADTCQSEQGTVINKAGKNVAKILKTIRNQYGYTGQIVLVNYYSLDYTNNTDNLNSYAVNYTIQKAAAPYNVTVADAFTAFQNASAPSFNPCTAGLLTQLNGGGCGIHPSATGQTLLAQTVESALSGGMSGS